MSRGRPPGAVAAGLLVVALVAGCAGPGGSEAGRPAASVTPSPTATAPPPTAPGTPPAPQPSVAGPSYSDWELGTHVLPVDARGFGEIRPTPKALRTRRFPTVDLLPPPADGGFHSTIAAVTPEIRTRMGEAWSPGCPVGIEELRHVTVSFRGFDGLAHTGELVIAAEAAEDVVSVFEKLFAADYPIEEMRLVTTADLEAPPTGDANNTAGTVCRATTGGSSWSAHAFGLAIDVNPFLNPYLKGDLVLPERASAYLDRSRTQPGVIHAGDVVVRAFARIGWEWGGAWSSLKDYQHFSATGR